MYLGTTFQTRYTPSKPEAYLLQGLFMGGAGGVHQSNDPVHVEIHTRYTTDTYHQRII